MPYDEDTGKFTKEDGTHIATLVNGQLVMEDGCKADTGWVRAALVRMGVMNKKTKKEVKKTKHGSFMNQFAGKVCNLPIVTEEATWMRLKSQQNVPNIGWVYRQDETGLEIKDIVLIDAARRLSDHRRYRNFGEEQRNPEQCRKDIMTYTAKRCAKAYLN